MLGNKNIIANIYRIQAHDSMMCRYFCIGFIGFMLRSKSLLYFIDLFSTNDYDKKNKIMLNIFNN